MKKASAALMPVVGRTITLGELLTEAQIKGVLEIMKHPDYHLTLTAYLEGIEPKLETKGVLPAYLAYYLQFARMDGQL